MSTPGSMHMHTSNAGTTTSLVIDTDELLAQHDAALHESAGHSMEIIQTLRRRKRYLEERAVCRQLLFSNKEQWGYVDAERWSQGDAVETFQFVSRTEEDYDHLCHIDDDAERRRIVLCYAAALDGLDQRINAITLLESYLRVSSSHSQDGIPPTHLRNQPNDASMSTHVCNTSTSHDRTLDIPVTLALAKLFFKGNNKRNAMQLCIQILDHIRARTSDSVSIADICNEDDAADAYHLAGWVYIHADDHTSAYHLWNEGAQRIQSCHVLETQSKKRHCWDQQHQDEIDCISESKESLVFHQDDFIPGRVPQSRIPTCPALGLFDSTTQKNQLVFVTKSPILSPVECARVLQHVDDYHKENCHGIWSTVRHSSVPTTDVAVEDIAPLRPWLRNLLQHRLYPMLCTAFPRLANASSGCASTTTTTTTPSTSDYGSSSIPAVRKLQKDQLRVHDAFIVRYDAERDMSLSLPEHSDTSLISFTIALNQRGHDFVGGGTWFESIVLTTTTTTSNTGYKEDGTIDISLDNTKATVQGRQEQHNLGCVVDANQGHAVAFAGPLRHAGYPITSGCRVILVLFLYAHDFSYGPHLEKYKEQHKSFIGMKEVQGTADYDCDSTVDSHTKRPSGDSPGGFVVYNQTVELVNMLNRQVASVLDE